MTLTPGHLPKEHRKIMRAVALAYRRVMRAPAEAAVTRAEISRLDQRRQSEALAAATAEYRRLSPAARYDRLAGSGEGNRIIAAAIHPDPPRVLDRAGTVRPSPPPRHWGEPGPKKSTST